MIELLLGITLFVLIFSHVMTAFAPTATDYQRIVRGYSFAITIANWYINRQEGLIFYHGHLPASELGLQRDITALIQQHFPNLQKELPKAKALVNQAKVGDHLYQIEFILDWEAGSKRHQYKINRLKTAPGAL